MAWHGANVWLGAQLSTGSRASFALWPLHQDSGHTFVVALVSQEGKSRIHRASLRRRLRAGTGYPPSPVPSCCLKQRESSGGKGLVQKARSTAELCWPLSGALHALPLQVVDSSVGGGLGPPQHPSCGLLAPRPASPPAALSRRDEGNRRCPGPSKRACYPPTPPSLRTFLWVSWRRM